MVNNKEKLFSVTAKDFDFEFCRGSGAGGQNRNKRDTAVRCVHRESGAVGQSCDERSQGQNKTTAWKRCVETDKFKCWLKVECIKKSGEALIIENKVDASMVPENLKIEVGDGITYHEETPNGQTPAQKAEITILDQKQRWMSLLRQALD